MYAVYIHVALNSSYLYFLLTLTHTHTHTGTSTDVSRYAGSYEHVMESFTAGITVQAPQVLLSSFSGYTCVWVVCYSKLYVKLSSQCEWLTCAVVVIFIHFVAHPVLFMQNIYNGAYFGSYSLLLFLFLLQLMRYLASILRSHPDSLEVD